MGPQVLRLNTMLAVVQDVAFMYIPTVAKNAIGRRKMLKSVINVSGGVF